MADSRRVEAMAMGETDMVTEEEALRGARHRDRRGPPCTSSSDAHQGSVARAVPVLYLAMGCFWGSETDLLAGRGRVLDGGGLHGGWTRTHLPGDVHLEDGTRGDGPGRLRPDAGLDRNPSSRRFWENHDPTTPEPPGGDVGTQYRSAIFATTEDQFHGGDHVARPLPAEVVRQGLRPHQHPGRPHRGTLADGVFYYAEDYHQGYLFKNPAATATTGSARPRTRRP